MVSIIVPVYNCIHTLGKCVETICAQTFEDWELLLIDDGSADGSGELCECLASEDPRIQVYHKPNGGVSSARNMGLDNAQGKYVMFCDSDDWVESNWCEIMCRIAENNLDCFPICNYYRNSSTGEAMNRPGQCKLLDKYIAKTDFFHLNQQELLGIPWNKIFKRSILEEYHIRFRTELSLGEDLIFNLDYLHHVGSFVFIDAPLYHYMVGNTDSLSAKFYPNLSEIYQILYSRIKAEMDCTPGSFEKWKQAYYRSYFFAFDRVFRNTWSDNTANQKTKWKYNSTVFHSNDFQICRHHISKHDINILQYYGLNSNSFYIYWNAIRISEKISRLIHHT